MKAQVRHSHLLRDQSLAFLCFKFYFTAGISLLKKKRRMWNLTQNDSSKNTRQMSETCKTKSALPKT